MCLEDVHALSAGLKAYVTTYTAKSLSICREACGGHGYAAVNRFGILRNDHDIFQTFEGDNTVLLQQPFQPAPAPLPTSLAGWMANPSVHPSASAGPIGFTPPNNAVISL